MVRSADAEASSVGPRVDRDPVEWALDLARVLALHSHTLLVIGDADLAAGAAIRLYMRNAEAVNSSPLRQAVHLDRLGQALGVAHAVHSAFDRTEPAQAALAVARAAGMDPRHHRTLHRLARAAAVPDQDLSEASSASEGATAPKTPPCIFTISRAAR
jgi:hypothetical protein